MEEQNQLTKKQRRQLKRQAKADAFTKQEKSQVGRRVFIWGSVILVVAFIVWGLVRGGKNASEPGLDSGPVAGLPAVTANEWMRGNPLATTTLVEYSDLQCPACQAAEPVVRQVVQKYGSQFRLVYRHYPLPQHQHSMEAARAAEAAGAQNKFWEMHDLLFDRQNDWQGQADVTLVFRSYANELKLDLTKFTADYNSDTLKQKIIAEASGGDAAGVNATPTFFLNGRHLQLSSYSDLLDEVANAIK